jgi:UDP:flavonoid glycosyltransferase YjiC (YdhE family)
LSRLHAFIAAGSAPLVFALGSSAVWMAGDFWETAVRATRRLGRRAILLTGSAANPHYGTDIASFEYLPYSSVFPHAAAVVHQAGMGTLAQALAAGRPQVLVPISFDQPDNADRAARLGAGPIVPFNQITVRRLEAALRQALPTRPPAHIAERIRAEDGAAKAADALLSL